MVFSSILFIAYFLPLFLLLYYASGMRTAALLTGSVFFYVWGEGSYIFLLAGMIAANHLVSHKIAAGGPAGRRWLIAILLLNVGVLAAFKYSDFAISNLNAALGTALGLWELKLPLGISFFTFQLISYNVDVYRGSVAPERKPLAFATYILMFPHLIAGPIVRYASIREELQRENRHRRLGAGIQYFIVGLCQKVLVANTLAPLADHAFNFTSGGLGFADAWLGLLSYTLQIYFDFCGYSNMAIGLAFMLGFTFPKNFDYPYSARSVTDFWRRWHISLSTWFRDYVYIPLGGNRGSSAKTMRNLLATFLLTGLWHGAAWNFIVWGLFHGAFLLLERAGLGQRLARAPVLVSTAYTLLTVMIGWVFFRAENLPHALAYLEQMFDFGAQGGPSVAMRSLMTPEVVVALAFGCLLAFPTWPRILEKIGAERLETSSRFEEARLGTLNAHAVPSGVLLVGFAIACALLAGSSLNPFLYFRF